MRVGSPIMYFRFFDEAFGVGGGAASPPSSSAPARAGARRSRPRTQIFKKRERDVGIWGFPECGRLGSVYFTMRFFLAYRLRQRKCGFWVGGSWGGALGLVG